MEIQLTRACSLILSGPQGSGKNLAAERLAEQRGKFVVIQLNDLVDKFRYWMSQEPSTVIVDEPCNLDVCMDTIKRLIAHEEIRVERKGMQPVSMRTPAFIVCTSAPLPGKYLSDPDTHVVLMPLQG